jgi:hypothetical protein
MLPLPANLAVFIETAQGDTLQDGSSLQKPTTTGALHEKSNV